MKKICFVAEYMYCGGTEKSLLSLYDCACLFSKRNTDITSNIEKA